MAFEGQGKLVVVGGREARKGDGEIETQGHVPLPVIEKAVDLLVRLPPALAQQRFRVLLGRRVDRYEAEGVEYAGELL